MFSNFLGYFELDTAVTTFGQLFREIGLLFILPSGHTCYETYSITVHSEIEYSVAAAAKLLLA